MKRKNWIWGLLILMLASFACNLPGSSSGPTPTADMITQVALTVNAQMTLVAQATTPQSTPGQKTSVPTVTLPPTAQVATLTPLPTSIPIPCNWAQFVADVTIPDDTEIQSGKSFVKSWRLQNVGTCTWTSAYQLIFFSGEAMNAPAVTTMTPVSIPPGGSVDVAVSLVAPAASGSYQGYYKLRAPDGTTFGIGPSANGPFWVKIKSVSPTATPSVTPSPTAVTLPDLIITAITFNPPSPTHGVPVHVQVSVYNNGSAPTSGSFTVKWWGLESYAAPSCTWVINSSLPAHGGVVEECDYNYPSAYAPGLLSKASADTENTIPESNEGNNELKVPVTVN